MEELYRTEGYVYGHASIYFGMTTADLLDGMQSEKDVEELKRWVKNAQELSVLSPDSVSPRLLAFIDAATPAAIVFTHGTEDFNVWPTSMLTKKLTYEQKQLPDLQNAIAYARSTPDDRSTQRWIESGIDKSYEQDIAEYQSNVVAISAVLQSRGVLV